MSWAAYKVINNKGMGEFNMKEGWVFYASTMGTALSFQKYWGGQIVPNFS